MYRKCKFKHFMKIPSTYLQLFVFESRKKKKKITKLTKLILRLNF